MKIALTICEYNPFHNGHAYSLNTIKQELKPDALIVIMSGNFTERGETAIMHKYKRATHAVLAGADMVIELPAVFATAPAEIFAKGATKLLNALTGEKTLCFGVESGTKSGLIATATALSQESKEFKNTLKQELKKGVPLAKARQTALANVKDSEIDIALTESPNNILAIEYTRAIIEGKYDMDILPIIRKGAGYKDLKGKDNISSAMAIRENIKNGKIKNCAKYLPSFVYQDLPQSLPNCDDLIIYSLNLKTKKQLQEILDCSEGLENRIKALAKDSYSREELLEKLATKRYTSTRLSRIVLSSALDISQDFVKKCLKSDLYLKILAINEDKLNLLSSLNPTIPFVMRKSDADNLKGTAKECFEKEVFANDIYNLITKQKTNEYQTKIVKTN